MKRLISIIFVLVAAVLQVAAQTCKDHKSVEIKEDTDGKLKAYCTVCHVYYDFDMWIQTEDMGITVTDPYLDVQADLCDAGIEKVYVSSTNQILECWLFNEATSKLYSYKDCTSAPSNSVELALPQTEKNTKLAFVAKMNVKKTSDSGMTTEVEYGIVHFAYKPYHSIKGLTVGEIANPDSVGVKNPNTEIKWYVENPADDDVMDDYFVVMRSNDSTFTQYTVIDSKSVKDFDNKETLEDGTVVGWFNVVDDTDDSQINESDSGKKELVIDEAIKSKIENSTTLSELDKTALVGFFSHPSKRQYYQVYRGMAQSLWPDHRGKFIVEDTLQTNSTLPAVTKIKVIQSNNWSEDKNVTVRIELQNPYPWEYNEITDSVTIHKFAEENGFNYRRYRWDEMASIKVERYSPESDHDNGNDALARTFTINGKDVLWDAKKGVYYAELQDCQSLPYTHYYYKASVDGSKSDFMESALNTPLATTEEEANMSVSKVAALIGSLEASRNLVGNVNVHWTIGSGKVDQLTLERREYSSEGANEWVPVNIAVDDLDYNDTKAMPGHVTEYRLTAIYKYRNDKYTSVKTAMGYPSYRGKLAGRVTMPNGVGIAGANVKVKRLQPKYIYIEDVYDSEGNLVMKGVQEGIDANAPVIRRVAEDSGTGSVDVYDDPTSYLKIVKTDETGAFELDDVLFSIENGVSTQYEISVDYGNSSFIYAGKNEPAKVSLNNTQPEKTNIVFTCSTYKKVTGNVYYENSTVPVREVSFSMTFNGTTSEFRNNKGELIKTDANGFFSILVPLNHVTVQMNKEGHKFKHDGYIVGSADGPDLLDENKTYDNNVYYDQTKTRLVGRLSGGNVEARKQLGFGMSKNNLGDNPTIILQLEGDNSSQIVYNVDEPETIQIDSVYTHPYRGLYPDHEGQTSVSYQRKRIVIKPDAVTGEFFVDLFPTKYKVTQLSAEGYSTLYNSGEGFDVIDLTDSIVSRTIENNADANMKVELQASYIRAYHKPATVTYEQYKYGSKTGYLGDQSIIEMNLSGKAVQAEIATYDKDSKEATYLFGYPVFTSGQKYTLQVRAHEDYFYNNDETNTLDEVHLDGGTLIVQNGLLDNNSKEEYELDSLGMATIVFTAGNTTFSQTEENALRLMNFSVKLNDYYYEANSLKAFVTGYRDKNTDVVSYDNDISVVDILRDPYGASSYSWMEKGATYKWTRSFNFTVGLTIKLTPTIGASASTIIGAWVGVGGGAVTASEISTSSTYSLPISIPFGGGYTYNRNASYSLVTNQKICTSSDPRDVGAMADVYIGTVHTAKVNTAESFSVIDQTTYDAVKGAIDRGTIRVVKEGKDSEGKNFYLVIAEKIHYTPDAEIRQFAYSQKYILGTLIPNLIDARDNLLIYTPDKSTVEELSKTTKEVKYWSKVPADDPHFGLTDYYEMVNESGKTAVDDVKTLNAMIVGWADVVAGNEQTKVDHMNDTGDNVTHHSVAGASIEYSENFTFFHKAVDSGNVCGFNLRNGNFTGIGASIGTSKTYSKGSKSYEEKMNAAIDKVNEDANTGEKTGGYEVDTQAPGLKLSFKTDYNLGFDVSDNKTYTKDNNSSRGYFIGTNDESHFDISVVKLENSKTSKKYLGTSDDIDWTTAGNKDVAKTAKYSDFLFFLKGGAVRNPYFDADSTVFTINGQRVALGLNPLKMDNPKIYVERPIVNNMPEDEKATFTLHLTNESELGQNIKYLRGSHFTLYVEDATNPNGAKFTIDGEPLTSGRDFIIAPGESIVKTLEVERGKGYDFTNLQLVFADTYFKLIDDAKISINYLPVASKVNISSPTDKWVMNTFSAKDDKGRYYIPVNIDGFNVHGDGFHHIELQYKKQTEGDSQWVNICGFYNDSTLYAQATGVKEMIPASGKINNVKFYGENDPMEMKYDLRAVAFRALGTGYVTRASNVMSGMKDTRCPEVFGLPKPTDGVLDYEDVISIPFNEPIAYNYLNKTSNFQIMGYLNQGDAQYSTSLRFSNSMDALSADNQLIKEHLAGLGDIPTSKVYRNLTNNDFTIDMMLKLDKDNSTDLLYVMVDTTAYKEKTTSNSYLTYLYSNKRFISVINGIMFTSAPIDEGTTMTGNFNHVGMSFKQEGSNGGPEVMFYLGDKELPTQLIANSKGEVITDSKSIEIESLRGIIMLGNCLSGSMVDVRLWDKALSHSEFMAKKSKRFSKNEPSLYAYWPIDEGNGNVLYDKVNGCDLHFTEPTWQMMEDQHSLAAKGHAVKFAKGTTENMQCSEYNDFTLSFWFNINNKTQLAKDTLALFKAGDTSDAGYFRLGVKEDGVVLTSAKNSYDIVSSNSFAKGWHNLVVIANKSQNTASVYYDGKLTSSLPGEAIAGMANYDVQFGDEGFFGNFDNFTFWNLAFPSNCIGMVYGMIPTGREMGLEYFLPFEYEKTVDGTNKSFFCPYNMKQEEVLEDGEATGKWKENKTDMFGLTEAQIADIDDDVLYCPVHAATGLTNIPFSWTATDNELQINIKKSDRDINHQNLNITVRNVEDLQGNVLVNPQMMMVYVNRNVLKWTSSNKAQSVSYGDDNGYLFLSFENVSGRTISYNLVENSSWLSIDETVGTIGPLGYEYFEAKISPDLAPGEYETTIYLVDENGLSAPLPVKVTVVASSPTWVACDGEDYKYTMNVMGKVLLTNNGDEYFDADENDIVGAFYKNVCLGSAHITKDAAGTPYVFLTIKGNDDMLPKTSNKKTVYKEISFQLWNAQTNQISILAPQNAGNRINFVNNGVVGCPPDEPVIFKPTNEIMQDISFNSGWNWISFNVTPKNDTGVNCLFQTNDVFTPGDRIVYVNKEGQRISSELIEDENGKVQWSNGIDGIDNTKHHVYQLYAKYPGTFTVFGYHIEDKDRFVTVSPNKTNPRKGLWNELPYLLEIDQPIERAMSDYSRDKSVVGTVIKNLTQFAVANANGKWVGSLAAMHPGQGYYTKYISTSDNPTDITIVYSNTTVAKNAPRLTKRISADDESVDLVLSEASEYNTSMPVIATLGEGVEYEDGDELIAYTNGVIAGRAKATDLGLVNSSNPEEGKLFFISVNAEEGAPIRFAIVNNGKVKGKSSNGVSYDSDIVCGSLDNPFAIDFTQTASGDVYDINGIKLGNSDNLGDRKGVFIINGKKQLK